MIPIKDIRIKSGGVIHPATSLKADGAIKGIKAIKRGGTVHEVDDEWLPLFGILRTISQTNVLVIELFDYITENKRVYIDAGNSTEIYTISSPNVTIPYSNGTYTIRIKGDLTNIKKIGGSFLPISFYWNHTLGKMVNLESLYVYNSSASTHNVIDFNNLPQLKQISLRKTYLVENKNLLMGIDSQQTLVEFNIVGYPNQVEHIEGITYRQDINKNISSISLESVFFSESNFILDINNINSNSITTFTALECPLVTGDINSLLQNNSSVLTRLQISGSSIGGIWDDTRQYPLFEWYFPGQFEWFNLNLLKNNGLVRLRAFYMYYTNDNIVGDIAIFGDIPHTVGNPYRSRQFSLRSSGITGSLTELVSKPYAPLYERHVFMVPNVTGNWSDHNQMFNTAKLSWVEIESKYLSGNIEDMSTLSSCTVVASTDKNFGGTFLLKGLAVRGNFGTVLTYIQAKWVWYSFTGSSFTVQNITDSINTIFENRNLLKTVYKKEVDYSASVNGNVTTGTYQQPSGFTHDLDEGNLTTLSTSWSIAEKIWVLENMQTSTTVTTKRYNWLFIYDGK